jgi:hypothetical protein
MKRILLAVLVLMLGVVAQAQASSPCGVVPTPGAPHVCFSWSASPTQGVAYNVYRATTSGGENYATPLNAVPLTTLYFYDTTVVDGTKYFYTVTAETGGAQSLPSPEASSIVPVPPSAPTSPAAIID